MLGHDINLNFDTFPFGSSTVPLYSFLPQWAKHGNLENMLAQLKTPTTFSKIKSDLPDLNLEDITITKAPFNKYLIGEKLSDYASEKNLNSKEAILHLMLATSLRASISLVDINLPLAEEMLFDDRALLGSSSSILEGQSFSKYLELAEKRVGLNLENIIQKITSVPAKKFGLKNRGVLKEGAFADIVLMQGNKVNKTLVNGIVALQDGELTNVRSGSILKK